MLFKTQHPMFTLHFGHQPLTSHHMPYSVVDPVECFSPSSTQLFPAYPKIKGKERIEVHKCHEYMRHMLHNFLRV